MCGLRFFLKYSKSLVWSYKLELLTDVEVIGIKVMALVRSGHMKMFRCSVCSDELKEERDCDNDNSESSVFYHEDIGEFYACPLKFISQSVIRFFKEYDTYAKFPNSAPNSYGEFNPRFLEAVFLYDGFIADIKAPKESKPPIGDDNMAKMRKLLNKG